MTSVLNVGDKVDKVKGYGFPGEIVAIFQTTRGETRVVVEMVEYGLLHIYSPEQLKYRE